MQLKTLIILSLALFTAGCSGSAEVHPTKSVAESINANPLSAAQDGSFKEPNPVSHDLSAVYKVNEHVIYSGHGTEKKVALTFDDGPDTKYTAQILDILKQNHIAATFFVTGEHATAHKEVLKRIAEAGHEIGNHSWDHVDLTKLDDVQLKEEIDRTDEAIKNVAGRTPSLFRPPYGALSKPVVDYTEKSHKLIAWSVDTRDWQGLAPEKMLQIVKKELKPGAIILQHSAGGKNGNLSNTVRALPQLVIYLKEQGYRFVTVSELLQ
jgi:peptidoglycan/xylan/chitin deacetylase (PgdA/CDA1 family)